MRDLDLSTTFGWELDGVNEVVDTDLVHGRAGFFASGGISCSPIDIPSEYYSLAPVGRTIYCGCVVERLEPEEAARRKQQFEFALRYNRELLRRLTAHIDYGSPRHVLDLLPSLEDIWLAHPALKQAEGRNVYEEETIKAFVDTPSGRAQERRLLNEANLRLGHDVEVLGLVGLSWLSTQMSNGKVPDGLMSLRWSLDGRVYVTTGISSVWDGKLDGPHRTFLVERDGIEGWGREALSRDGAYRSGFFYVGESYYRFAVMPGTYRAIMARSHRDNAEKLDQHILEYLSKTEAARTGELRRLEIEELWDAEQLKL